MAQAFCMGAVAMGVELNIPKIDGPTLCNGPKKSIGPNDLELHEVHIPRP